jgi:GNAT superfamily N-acetyltransferase
MTATSIQIAETDDDIVRCLPVLRQLRPHLADVAAAVARVRRQQRTGFRLGFLSDGEHVVAVAGFRLLENLAWGRFLYVDDLVTDEACRSGGHGERLLAWLIDLAKESGCDQVHLDSGVQRFDAHRFYLRHRFRITSHHFALQLRPT